MLKKLGHLSENLGVPEVRAVLDNCPDIMSAMETLVALLESRLLGVQIRLPSVQGPQYGRLSKRRSAVVIHSVIEGSSPQRMETWGYYAASVRHSVRGR